MKFLIDECIGPSIARLLSTLGYDALSVYDCMPEASDTEILKRAHLENRILITCDKDFGEIIFRKQQIHTGLILLRIGNQYNRLPHILRSILDKHTHEIENNFIVATEKSIRVIKTIVEN